MDMEMVRVRCPEEANPAISGSSQSCALSALSAYQVSKSFADTAVKRELLIPTAEFWKTGVC